MIREPYKILRRPIVTEKSMAAKDRSRTLCFQVDQHATKPEIKQAVQSLFKVKVESVRTAVFSGKMRRRGRTVGYRPDWKKAYIKLRSGEKVPEFLEGG